MNTMRQPKVCAATLALAITLCGCPEDGDGSSDAQAGTGSSDTGGTTDTGGTPETGGTPATGGTTGTGGTVVDPGDKKCVVGGCSSQLCVDDAEGGGFSTCEYLEEYACYENASCGVQADGNCGWTQTDELEACLGGGSNGPLAWWSTCGDSACGPVNDDPAIPNCDETAGAIAGESCGEQDAKCETLSCGVRLICTDSDPTGGGPCPISRTEHKRDIRYLESHERRALHDQLMSLPLASYHYKRHPNGPRELGFLIEDVEPSGAVRGDRVNLYGYLSMAVAALQEQSQQITALRSEVEALKAASEQRLSVCGP